MMTALACLAVAIYFEARSEPIDAQMAVAEVVINRVADPRWPDDVCAVIKQPRQFSFYYPGVADTIADPEAYQTALTVAQDALDGHVLGHGATHYHADWIAPPDWSYRLEFVGKIGAHIFFRGW